MMGYRKSFLVAISAALFVMAGCSDSKKDVSTPCEDGAKKCESNKVMECQSKEWKMIQESYSSNLWTKKWAK